MTMTSLLKALRRSLPRGRSVAAVAFAALLLTGAAGAGVLGPTAEQYADDHGPVGEAEAFACGGVCLAAGVGIAAGAASGYLLSEYVSGDPKAETYTRADAGETKTEVYTHAKTIQQDSEMFTTVVNNQAGDGMRTVAWSKGKIAVISSLNANESESMATNKGTQAVNEYYAVTEMNVVQNWNSAVDKAAYLGDVYQNHESLTSAAFREQAAGNPLTGTESVTYTLVNGTRVDVLLPVVGSSTTISPFDRSRISGDSTATHWYFNRDARNQIEVRTPDDAAWEGPILAGAEYQRAISAIWNGNSQMEGNIQLYTNNTYSQYSAGDINATSMMDPTTLAQEMSTNYEDTGYFAYASADLAAQGMAGDLNRSMSIETASGTTLNGTLFTDWSPPTNGSFQTGTWYTVPNGTLVYVATNDGLRLIDDDTDFRINSMTNTKTGENVNETTLQTYNRQTADVTLTQEQLDQLAQLMAKYDEMEQDAATGGGGSGGGIGDALNSKHLLALLALVAAAAVLTRS